VGARRRGDRGLRQAHGSSHLKEEAGQIDDADRRKRHTSWAHVSESASGLRNMVKVAATEPDVAVNALDLGRDPWLLNVVNGTLDLRTGTLREHARDDLITKLAPVEYHADARCPRWEAFLKRITGDPDLEAFLRRAVGYTLTGLTDEEVIFFTYGPAATGKSTFLDAIRAVLGDEYARVADFEAFLKKRGDNGVRNDLARLAGARMVIASEVQEGRSFDAATLKAITGGDRIAARYLYKETFEFKPQFALWLGANDRPAIAAHDSGMWRRMRLIPFMVTIPEGERDPALKQRLTRDPDSQAAILAWAVRGCQEWQSDGLAVPAIVHHHTDGYRDDNDPMREWRDACCVLDPEARTLARDLEASYQRWIERNEGRRVSGQEWGSTLKHWGLKKVRGTGGTRAWHGIALLVTSDKQ
jgi:putative DNA primase/helicase